MMDKCRDDEIVCHLLDTLENLGIMSAKDDVMRFKIDPAGEESYIDPFLERVARRVDELSKT
jgi:hypothetical protein